VATNGAQHLRAETLLVLAQEAEDAGKAADAVADLGEKFRGRARTKRVEVLDTALLAEPGDRVEVNHWRWLSAPRQLPRRAALR
jgi:hypothetical protein